MHQTFPKSFSLNSNFKIHLLDVKVETGSPELGREKGTRGGWVGTETDNK